MFLNRFGCISVRAGKGFGSSIVNFSFFRQVCESLSDVNHEMDDQHGWGVYPVHTCTKVLCCGERAFVFQSHVLFATLWNPRAADAVR